MNQTSEQHIALSRHNLRLCLVPHSTIWCVSEECLFLCVCFYMLESTVKGGMQHVLNPLNSVDSPAWYEKHRWSGTDPALCQRSVSIRKAVNIGGVRVCGADSRHGHVAAIYDYVSKFLTSWLIWQFQCVGCPQRLMETCQTSHWRCWGVICRRNPHSDPMKTCVADGLIWRGWGPGDGLSWLRRPIKKNVIVNNRRRWFMIITMAPTQFLSGTGHTKCLLLHCETFLQHINVKTHF